MSFNGQNLCKGLFIYTKATDPLSGPVYNQLVYRPWSSGELRVTPARGSHFHLLSNHDPACLVIYPGVLCLLPSSQKWSLSPFHTLCCLVPGSLSGFVPLPRTFPQPLLSLHHHHSPFRPSRSLTCSQRSSLPPPHQLD